MTRKEAKEMLPIIQAYAEGKAIQIKKEGDWLEVCQNTEVYFSESPSDYRIKPEPKYRPFRTQEECWKEMHKHLDFGWIRYGDFICTIQTIAPDGIAISDGLETNNFDFKECLMNTKFIDDTPFGIKEQ